MKTLNDVYVPTSVLNLRMQWDIDYNGMLAITMQTLQQLQEACLRSGPVEFVVGLALAKSDLEFQVPWILLFNPNMSQADADKLMDIGTLPDIPEVQAYAPHLESVMSGFASRRYHFLIPGPRKITDWNDIQIGGHTIVARLERVLEAVNNANRWLIRIGQLRLPYAG